MTRAASSISASSISGTDNLIASTGFFALLAADGFDDAEDVEAEDVEAEASELVEAEESDDAAVEEAESDVDVAAALWEALVPLDSLFPPDATHPLMPETMRTMSRMNTMPVAIIVFHGKRSTKFR